jgi:hypothetical protein
VIPIETRFWSKVEIGGTDFCWLWKAGKLNAGKFCYGVIRNEFGVTELAHRVSWRLAGNILQGEQCILHHCDNPRCVNPNHLFAGTKGDNNRDRHSKGRDASGLSQRIASRRARTADIQSSHMGVSWSKNKSKWRADILIEGKRKTIGFYKTEEAAALAYLNVLPEAQCES